VLPDHAPKGELRRERDNLDTEEAIDQSGVSNVCTEVKEIGYSPARQSISRQPAKC
jgi:hypothetical protein